MTINYNRAKWACYTANICMAMVVMMPALLFVSLREMYGISYSMLGLLVVFNFTTQLIVDIIFSVYAHKFNIPKVVKSIPIIATVGFLLYALIPMFLPEFAYLGLVVGTIIFSSASGFAEVLVSPVIAAIPSYNPDREMSKLHSVYAWGAVGVTVVTAVILHLVGAKLWYIPVFCLMIIPIVSAFLFSTAKIPELETPEKASGIFRLLKNKSMIFCFASIFLGGASEVVMSQWSSGYLERSIMMPKLLGDILGVAFFSVMLGVGRTLYAHRGRNIRKVIFLGSVGAALCYAVVIFFDFAPFVILACAFTGFFVSMLWPGNLIVVQEKIPTGGVAMFALMAAGGDLGASVGPQLVGLVTDTVINSDLLSTMGANFGYTAEQFGMKAGMLTALVFPFVSAILGAVGYFSYRKDREKLKN